MTRPASVFALLSLLALGVWAAPHLRIGYFYGQREYDGEGALRWLAGRMDSAYGAKAFFFAGQDVETDTSDATAIVIPNLDELDSLDVLVVDVRRLWLNKAQLARMQAFLDAGKGIVGIRAAAYAFQSWDQGRGMDSVILGGAYNGHTAEYGYDLELTDAAKASPIFAGVQPWKAGDKLYLQNYRGRGLQPDCTVLMVGIQGTTRSPVAWTRLRKGSRIFNTTTGVQSDVKDPRFQLMITRAVLWAGNALEVSSLAPSRPRNPRVTLPGRASERRCDGRLIPGK